MDVTIISTRLSAIVAVSRGARSSSTAASSAPAPRNSSAPCAPRSASRTTWLPRVRGGGEAEEDGEVGEGGRCGGFGDDAGSRGGMSVGAIDSGSAAAEIRPSTQSLRRNRRIRSLKRHPRVDRGGQSTDGGGSNGEEGLEEPEVGDDEEEGDKANAGVAFGAEVSARGRPRKS